MIKVGEIYKLKVIDKQSDMVFVGKDEQNERILLHECDEVLNIGDVITCFIYKDGNKEKKATLHLPPLTLGKVAALKVVSINRIGAFLEWGLEKDLFLPFKQQVGRLKVGETYVVGLYIDKSDRLCATMKVYDLLKGTSLYKVNDEVEGIVYNVKEAFGAFVAVDGCYHGLIPTKELYKTYQIGERVRLRVKDVKADGKLELSERKPIHFQMEEDVRYLMEELDKHEGILKLNDKSAPEMIRAQLNMSKAAFKRAVGRLLKEGVIEIKSDGIYRNW